MTIGEYIFNFVVNNFFGGTYNNVWLTENLGKIQGIITVVITAVVFVVAIALVWALARAFMRFFTFWE